MQTRAANAAECVPEPAQIAGTRMLPFCLGHHLLFRRLGLPFAGSPAADCGEGEVLIGVLVCAQHYETTLEQLHSGEWPTIQAKWLRDVTKRCAKSGQTVGDIEARFRAYLETGYQQPPVCGHAKGEIQMSAPWECLLKVGLMRAGFSETEVLNGYLPCRWYDYFTALELAAAETCEDPKRWRTIFYNQREAEAIAAVKEWNNGDKTDS